MIGTTRESAVVCLWDKLAREAEADRRRGREPDGSTLTFTSFEVPLANEHLEVVMDGRRRGQTHCLHDLADRRRIPAGTQRRGDEVQDPQFSFGVVLRHSRLLAGIIPNGRSMSRERSRT
jgi:hypothetical protein